MQKFSLLLDSEDQARDVMRMMWNDWGIRGEMEMVPMDGRYKLDVVSEQDLTTQQFESLPGKRN